ncbi:MAG: efflux RND transporter permease subunit, partial [Bacteroidota bacterium]
VRVQLAEEFRKNPDDVSSLLIRVIKKNQEYLVPLSELVKIKKEAIPIEIFRYMGSRGMSITAKLDKGYSMMSALLQIRSEANSVLPETASIQFAGESKRFLDESQSLFVIFGFALAFIYMVLAAQYESWRDPVIILLSVPLSLTGAVFALYGMGLTMNLYSQIGLVTLIGLISKHGILIVDFANQLKDGKGSRFIAVIESCRLRLRPILMTTFAMVFGAIPLAIATGAGMETRQPIGWSVVGGMTLGTIFTLFVVPVVYTLLSRKPDNEQHYKYG